MLLLRLSKFCFIICGGKQKNYIDSNSKYATQTHIVTRCVCPSASRARSIEHFGSLFVIESPAVAAKTN